MTNKRNLIIIAAAIVAIAFAFMSYNTGNKKKDFLDSGVLGYLGMTEEEFQEGFNELREFMLSPDNQAKFEKESLRSYAKEHRRNFHFYNSLMALMMDLKAGKLDEIILPESVGLYLLSRNSFYRDVQSIEVLESGICFGFREDNEELRQNFDKIINDMEADGTLEKLRNTYVSISTRDPAPKRPHNFEAADTLKVVVTGDMPPIDMFAGDGKPTGYNTAILTEIGKRLGKNIIFINADAGGRAAALSSGRADVVFWYRVTQSKIEGPDPLDELFKDVPDGVILSRPYYSWGRELVIRMKD